MPRVHDLTDEMLAFWVERHLCTVTTLRADGRPHVVPLGVALDGGLDEPRERGSEAWEPGPDRLERDPLASPDRHRRAVPEPVRGAVDHDRVARDRDGTVVEEEPARLRGPQVPTAYDVLDAAEQVELPGGQRGRLRHRRGHGGVDAQHDSPVL